MSPTPALCIECAHSNAAKHGLDCMHPKVMLTDAWVLASLTKGQGSSCKAERGRVSPFAPCGRRGKLWAAKPAVIEGET